MGVVIGDLLLGADAPNNLAAWRGGARRHSDRSAGLGCCIAATCARGRPWRWRPGRLARGFRQGRWVTVPTKTPPAGPACAMACLATTIRYTKGIWQARGTRRPGSVERAGAVCHTQWSTGSLRGTPGRGRPGGAGPESRSARWMGRSAGQRGGSGGAAARGSGAGRA